MSIHIETIQHEDHIRIVMSGPFETQEAIQVFTDVFAMSRITDLSKILIDYRSLQCIPAATEKLLCSINIEQQYNEHLNSGGQPLRVAYLGSAPAVGSYRPGHDWMKIANLPFHVFTDEKKAYQWLDVETT